MHYNVIYARLKKLIAAINVIKKINYFTALIVISVKAGRLLEEVWPTVHNGRHKTNGSGDEHCPRASHSLCVQL